VTNPTRYDLLRLDIDTRIHDLWADALAVEEWDMPNVAAFMRAAYARGLVDALTEPDPTELFRVHGYRVPRRSSA
jgi:hypothetical protein